MKFVQLFNNIFHQVDKYDEVPAAAEEAPPVASSGSFRVSFLCSLFPVFPVFSQEQLKAKLGRLPRWADRFSPPRSSSPTAVYQADSPVQVKLSTSTMQAVLATQSPPVSPPRSPPSAAVLPPGFHLLPQAPLPRLRGQLQLLPEARLRVGAVPVESQPQVVLMR